MGLLKSSLSILILSLLILEGRCQLFGWEYIEFPVPCSLGVSRPDGVSFCVCVTTFGLRCNTRNVSRLRDAVKRQFPTSPPTTLPTLTTPMQTEPTTIQTTTDNLITAAPSTTPLISTTQGGAVSDELTTTQGFTSQMPSTTEASTTTGMDLTTLNTTNTTDMDLTTFTTSSTTNAPINFTIPANLSTLIIQYNNSSLNNHTIYAEYLYNLYNNSQLINHNGSTFITNNFNGQE